MDKDREAPLPELLVKAKGGSQCYVLGQVYKGADDKNFIVDRHGAVHFLQVEPAPTTSRKRSNTDQEADVQIDADLKATYTAAAQRLSLMATHLAGTEHGAQAKAALEELTFLSHRIFATAGEKPPPLIERVALGTQTSRPNSPQAITDVQTNATVGQATPCPTCSHLRDIPTPMEADPTATPKAKPKKKKNPRKATQPGLTPSKSDTGTQGASTSGAPEQWSEVVGRKAARRANKAAPDEPSRVDFPPSQLPGQLQGGYLR